MGNLEYEFLLLLLLYLKRAKNGWFEFMLTWPMQLQLSWIFFFLSYEYLPGHLLDRGRPGTVVSNREEDAPDRLSSTHGNEGSTSSDGAGETTQTNSVKSRCRVSLNTFLFCQVIVARWRVVATKTWSPTVARHPSNGRETPTWSSCQLTSWTG